MARPKKQPDKVRGKLMQVRLQESEIETFREAADTAGLDLSSWVRERLLTAARGERRRNQKK